MTLDGGWGLAAYIILIAICVAVWLSGKLRDADDRRQADEIRRVMLPEQRWPGGGW